MAKTVGEERRDNRRGVETGGFAFPGIGNNGMTLRDWFAGQAIGHLVSDHELFKAGNGAGLQLRASRIAKQAYEIADAMIEARKD